jgi:uncharacterized oxidoreductase
MTSLVFDPAAFAGEAFFAGDIARLIEWTKASSPLAPDGVVQLSGEMEQTTRCERSANGIPFDPETLAQIRAAGEN